MTTTPLSANRIEELRKAMTLQDANGNVWLDEITTPEELLRLLSMLTPAADAAYVKALEAVAVAAWERRKVRTWGKVPRQVHEGEAEQRLDAALNNLKSKEAGNG